MEWTLIFLEWTLILQLSPIEYVVVVSKWIILATTTPFLALSWNRQYVGSGTSSSLFAQALELRGWILFQSPSPHSFQPQASYWVGQKGHSGFMTILANPVLWNLAIQRATMICFSGWLQRHWYYCLIPKMRRPSALGSLFFFGKYLLILYCSTDCF